jgi:hypothetical protein
MQGAVTPFLPWLFVLPMTSHPDQDELSVSKVACGVNSPGLAVNNSIHFS